jgi:hypothetical protein
VKKLIGFFVMVAVAGFLTIGSIGCGGGEKKAPAKTEPAKTDGGKTEEKKDEKKSE